MSRTTPAIADERPLVESPAARNRRHSACRLRVGAQSRNPGLAAGHRGSRGACAMPRVRLDVEALPSGSCPISEPGAGASRQPSANSVAREAMLRVAHQVNVEGELDELRKRSSLSRSSSSARLRSVMSRTKAKNRPPPCSNWPTRISTGKKVPSLRRWRVSKVTVSPAATRCLSARWTPRRDQRRNARCLPISSSRL